jgi:hypothetical protein
MSPRRKRQSAARKSLSATPSVVGDKIRTAAAVYEKAGQRDRAEGMRQAADIVDKHARGGSEDLVDFALMQIDEAVGILTDIRRQVRADLFGDVAEGPIQSKPEEPRREKVEPLVEVARQARDEMLARRIFAAFDEHIHVPPELEERLLARIQQELKK